MRTSALLPLAMVPIVIAAIGCSDSSMAPSKAATCNSAGSANLGVLQAATFDCSNGGTVITLGGGGARYLIVPQFATARAANQPVPYTLQVSAGAIASTTRVGLRPPEVPSLSARVEAQTGRGPRPGQLQEKFDAIMRAADRKHARSFGSAASMLTLEVQPPTLGSLRDFHVVAVMDTATPVTKRVTAALDYIGQNILIYVDTLAPSGFTNLQILQLGQLFDQTLYPLDLNTFGAPSDKDQNGRVIMLLTPVVNALTPSSQCGQGFVAGFFDGFDLVSSDTTSNQGEVFYGIVPDPTGAVSCPHSLNNVVMTVPSVFLHELQHLINFSQHVLVHNGVPEEGWLDEGLSLVAQELGSLYYEARFPPPTGRSNPNQLFPDSAESFIGVQLASSYQFLLKPDTVTLTLHSDADNGLIWRGGDWLLARWLGDQGGAGFYQKLEQTALTGTANIASAAGEPFPALFGDFSLALYTDSIPGVPKSAIPPRNRFTTRTLRTLYQAYFNAAGPSATVPAAFPIAPVGLVGTVHASEVPGTPAFYVLNTAASASQLELDFTGSSGAGALDARLQPQISVFRLPGP